MIETFSTDHRHSYLLDDGMDIVVWFGKLSKLTQNKKTTLFAEKINKLERKNKATLVFTKMWKFRLNFLFFRFTHKKLRVWLDQFIRRVDQNFSEMQNSAWCPRQEVINHLKYWSYPYCRITVITKYETEKQHIFFSMLNGDPTSIKDPTVGKIEDYEDSYSVPTPKLYEVYSCFRNLP